jgi:predicted nucleic acid-binding protein
MHGRRKDNLFRFFKHPVTILEAKYWGRRLNDSDPKDTLDKRDPTAQTVKYLDDVYHASESRIQWAILTNGKHWRAAADKIVLIDTSSWIEALRANGQEDIRQRVKDLMLKGKAAWCDLIVVELWNGARGDYEKQKLRELENEIICIETTPEVWDKAKSLARKCRLSGQTIPVADLIITACAICHKTDIEHCDEHIDSILKISQSNN